MARRAAAVVAVDEGLARLPGLLTTSESEQSNRDRMARIEYVDGETYNAIWDADGKLLVQALIRGGEELLAPDPPSPLSAALRAQFDAVCEIVLGTYTIFGLPPEREAARTAD